MTRNPLVTVVLPVRNGAAFLAEAVESILEQDLDDYEFTIVDDGSTDDTPSILRRFAQRDRRIRLLATGGEGIVAALNLGLAEARGCYVARMDADDVALPGRLSAQAAHLESMPQTVALGTAAIVIDALGRQIQDLTLPTSAEEVSRKLKSTNPLLHPTVMMRRSAVESVGRYRAVCTYAEDYDLWLRLARIGELENLAGRLLKLRRHPGQVSTMRRLEQRAAFALARQLNFGEFVTTIDAKATLRSGLSQFLAERSTSLTPISPMEAQDLAIMLRATASNGALMGRGLWQTARRVARAGSDWSLLAKLLLRR